MSATYPHNKFDHAGKYFKDYLQTLFDASHTVNEQTIQDAAACIKECFDRGGMLYVCGNGGLIPIVSKETTINIEKFGIEIKSLDRIGIDNAVSVSRSLDTNTLKDKSLNCGQFVNENHSIKNFTDAFTKSLEDILSQAKK